MLDRFEGLIHPLAEPTYLDAREEALARIAARDEREWPILAVALTLEVPIWTEDQDFFGAGVPTWTTGRVRLYFTAGNG